MKKRILSFIFAIFLIVPCLFVVTACSSEHKFETNWSYDETRHYHKCTKEGHTDVKDSAEHTFETKDGKEACSICGYEKSETSEVDNFTYWLAGRNDALNNTHSAYTFVRTGNEYLKDSSVDTETLMAKGTQKSSYTSGKYFSTSKIELLSEGTFVVQQEEVSAIKNVLVDGVEKTKQYNKVYNPSSSSEPMVEASYEWADELERYGYFNGKTTLMVEMSYYPINEGTTYEELVAKINAEFMDEYEKNADSISLVKNADGSVSLVYNISYAEISNYMQGKYPDYTETQCIEEYSITVKDGKIVELKEDETQTAIYTDSTKNETYRYIDTTLVSYAFDDVTYDSISVETETTINNLKGHAVFIVEGCSDHRLSFDKLVGETVTLSDIQNAINSNLEFLITSSGSDDSQYYEIYTDAEMTNLFTSAEMPRTLTLYVKLIPAEGHAIVITYFHRGDRTAIKLIYTHYVAGYVYTQNDHFEDYPIISIDGEEKTSVTCVAGRVHKVVYQVPDNLIF